MAARWKRELGRLTLAAVLLAPLSARAEAPKPDEPWENVPATRRSGLVIGFAVGAGIGSVAGFPNDPLKIEHARYYTFTGVRPATLGSAWFGGALSDWLNFTIGVAGGNFVALDHGDRALAGGLTFHIEGFPLFELGGRYRDVGIFTDLGTGTVLLQPADSSAKLVDSGAASLVGIGTFYEGFRFWHVGCGPYATFDYMWSASARRPGVFLGWRSVIYTGTFAK